MSNIERSSHPWYPWEDVFISGARYLTIPELASVLRRTEAAIELRIIRLKALGYYTL